MKKIIGVVAALIVVFVGLTIVLSLVPISSDDIYDNYVDRDFEITKAIYDIEVSENRSAQVNELITVRFLSNNKRGIIRDLPTNSGEQYYNISVEGDEYYVKSEGAFVSIYTGNDYIAKYDYGDIVTYAISYTVVPPVRTIDNTNYYMNVVPFGWATSQSDVTVNMSFPYTIEDIEVFMGSYGTTNKLSSNSYYHEGGEFSLHTDKLLAHNGVTVDVELGRKLGADFSLPGLLAILVSLAVIAVAVCVKMFIVKDRNIFPVINANPPLDNGKEIDPAEMGYLIDNNCEPKDITALIFYFASKGLIKLEEDGMDEFTLIKTGDIDPDAPYHQKIIFNGLFKNREKVTTSELKDTFYGNIALSSSEIKREYSGKLTEKSAKTASVFTAIFGVLIILAVVALMTIRVEPTIIIRGGILTYVVLIIAAIFGYLFGRYVFDNKHKKSLNKMLIKCCVAAVVAILVSLFGANFLLGGIFPYYARVVLIAALAVLGFICGLIGRKTEYYASLMNEISGFKEFLETAEKERLEAMLEENPQYYYDILPYANVLGVSDKWEDKFKELENVPPPSYYYGDNLFDFILINAMFRSSFASFTNVMVSRPGSSSYSGGGRFGGGFGGFGGGFGGGGFGGGGGRSR